MLSKSYTYRNGQNLYLCHYGEIVKLEGDQKNYPTEADRIADAMLDKHCQFDRSKPIAAGLELGCLFAPPVTSRGNAQKIIGARQTPGEQVGCAKTALYLTIIGGCALVILMIPDLLRLANKIINQ